MTTNYLIVNVYEIINFCIKLLSWYIKERSLVTVLVRSLSRNEQHTKSFKMEEYFEALGKTSDRFQQTLIDLMEEYKNCGSDSELQDIIKRSKKSQLDLKQDVIALRDIERKVLKIQNLQEKTPTTGNNSNQEDTEMLETDEEEEAEKRALEKKFFEIGQHFKEKKGKTFTKEEVDYLKSVKDKFGDKLNFSREELLKMLAIKLDNMIKYLEKESAKKSSNKVTEETMMEQGNASTSSAPKAGTSAGPEMKSEGKKPLFDFTSIPNPYCSNVVQEPDIGGQYAVQVELQQNLGNPPFAKPYPVTLICGCGSKRIVIDQEAVAKNVKKPKDKEDH